MVYVITNNELYHYGVKGMKWGVRNTKSYSSSKVTNKTKTVSDKRRQAIKIGIAIAGATLAAYGTYKLVERYGYEKKAKAIVEKYAHERATKFAESMAKPLPGMKETPGKREQYYSEYLKEHANAQKEAQKKLVQEAYDVKRKNLKISMKNAKKHLDITNPYRNMLSDTPKVKDPFSRDHYAFIW